MPDLEKLLKENNYKKINFRISKTKHLVVKALINGIPGDFIIDTGASTTCIDSSAIVYFNLVAEDSKVKASGAGGPGMIAQVSNDNVIKIGTWKNTSASFVIFDLSHVNDALAEQKARPVHGILGANVLEEGQAIIDYKNQFLFLR